MLDCRNKNAAAFPDQLAVIHQRGQPVIDDRELEAGDHLQHLPGHHLLPVVEILDSIKDLLFRRALDCCHQAVTSTDLTFT